MMYKWTYGDFYVLTVRKDAGQAIRAFKEQYGLDVQAHEMACEPYQF